MVPQHAPEEDELQRVRRSRSTLEHEQTSFRYYKGYWVKPGAKKLFNVIENDVRRRNGAMVVLWLSVVALFIAVSLDNGEDSILTDAKCVVPIIAAATGLAVYVVS